MINLQLSNRTQMLLFAMLCLTPFSLGGYYLWTWQNDWRLIHATPEKSTLTLVHQTEDFTHFITEGHLFGYKHEGDVPLTNLQIRVTGIVKSFKKSVPSKAYISTDGQPSKVFTLNDEISPAVKIHAITPDAVIVENNNHLEKILLPRQHLTFKPRIAGTHHDNKS